MKRSEAVKKILHPSTSDSNPGKSKNAGLDDSPSALNQPLPLERVLLHRVHARNGLSSSCASNKHPVMPMKLLVDIQEVSAEFIVQSGASESKGVSNLAPSSHAPLFPRP